MKPVVTTLLCLLSLSLFAQKQITVQTTPEKATLFLKGVQLFHNASVQIPQGQSDIIVEGIADGVDENSVQAGGTGNFTILDVHYRLYYPEPKGNPAADAMQKKIKATQDTLQDIDFQIKDIAGQKDVLQVEKNMLLNNKLLRGEGKSDSLRLIQQTLEYYDRKLNEINTAMLGLDRKTLEVQAKRAEVQQRLDALSNYWQQQNAQQPANKPVPQIILSVAADAACSGHVSVNYITYSAGWFPTYDIRASDISKPVELDYKANVWQQTGIDWKNIRITCSTGNPSLGNTLPVLNTWYLGYYRQTYDQYNTAPVTRAEGQDKETMDNYLDEQNAASASAYTQVTQTMANVEFAVDLAYSIPADGQSHVVALQSNTLDASYNYLIIPKIEQSAFLVARITDWENASLMPGYSNIYFNNTYVGKTYLDPNTMNDTLSLCLGRDPSIDVKRTQILDKSSDKLLGANDKKSLVFEISIHNTKAVPVEVIVKDQLPISQDDDIKVSLKKSDGGDLNVATGEITWRETLDPKENRKYQLAFDIVYPKNEGLSMF